MVALARFSKDGMGLSRVLRVAPSDSTSVNLSRTPFERPFAPTSEQTDWLGCWRPTSSRAGLGKAAGDFLVEVIGCTVGMGGCCKNGSVHNPRLVRRSRRSLLHPRWSVLKRWPGTELNRRHPALQGSALRRDSVICVRLFPTVWKVSHAACGRLPQESDDQSFLHAILRDCRDDDVRKSVPGLCPQEQSDLQGVLPEW